MIFSNKKTIFNELEDYVRSWSLEELVFSYKLVYLVTPAGLVLTLHQEQTGFSLTITLQPSPGSLHISKFILTNEERLESLCQPLYDAALIEKVLQGLNLIAFCVRSFNKQEINFMLAQEEANDLISFKDLFHSISSHLTIAGKRQLFTLIIGNDFFEMMEDMKMQLRQKLWTYQKNNSLVRKYFQSMSQNKRIGLEALLNPSSPRESSTNIISFPAGSSHQAFI
ncbi:MAG: hypothetical protein K0M45_07140 [Candidatus Paracaedibacteraceae bacterium]|nr:hypothetical protein [Candidatus Paracaedibacteraceae bacterium]